MDNDLKLKFVRWKRLTYWPGKSIKKNRKKAYFLGHPVIQAVETKMIGLFFTKYSYFYKIFCPWKNQPFLLTTSLDFSYGERPGSLIVKLLDSTIQ